MTVGPYEGLVLDLDGTLVSYDGQIRHASRDRLRRIRREGGQVVIATGRSEGGLRELAADLDLGTPAVCYNGAAFYHVADDRLEVRHAVAEDVVAQALDFAHERGAFAVSMVPGRKYAVIPEDDEIRRVLSGFHDLEFGDRDSLQRPGIIRLALFSRAYPSSAAFAEVVSAALSAECYIAHIPLQLIPGFQETPYQMVDVHAPCEGKAEALALLEEEYGIPRRRVIAVGDADNDRPMLEAAGLGVAMGNAVASLKECADRIIGSCDTDAIADLVDELFLASLDEETIMAPRPGDGSTDDGK